MFIFMILAPKERFQIMDPDMDLRIMSIPEFVFFLCQSKHKRPVRAPQPEM